MFTPRPYQKEAIDKAIDGMRYCLDALLLELATGAGKSIIVAKISETVCANGRNKVLCLAPSKELTEQNYEKYTATGAKASFYSASIAKSLKHDVIFGTPLTVKNGLDKVKKLNIAAVILDEAHMITPTIKEIISVLKAANPQLRILGMTATPYRTKEGYIYEVDENDVQVEEALEPYFKKLLYRKTAEELIEDRYLTRPIHGDEIEQYDTSSLVMKGGKFDSKSVDKAFLGHGRKTSKIVEEIISKSSNRNGVLIFTANIDHAKEVLASLPPEISTMVDGKTSKNERKQILRDFKDMKLKYLVNVSVLTTGFDAPHVDVVAVLRATESAGLFQQIIGRGTRLYEGKTNFLVLDYAENISRHELHESLFKPTITAGFKSKGGGNMTAICPVCAFENQVTARPNPDGYEINEYGNFTDALGEEVLTDDGRPYPAHFGRSCQSFLLTDKSYVQCSHKFTSKKCTECGHDNDISARRCKACRHELIDPNEKLKLDYEKFKSDPRKLSVDNVLAWTIQRWHSQSGNDMVKVEYTTEYRTFPVWYSPKIRATWLDFTEQVFGIQTTDIYDVFSRISIGKMPKTITVVKDGKFYKVTKHNESQKANSAYFR